MLKSTFDKDEGSDSLLISYKFMGAIKAQPVRL